MTLVVPQARAWCSACNGKLWPRAELFSVVSEECRCHMRCLSPYAMLLRLVGRTKKKKKKEKQQLDMSVCVCVCKQTNQRAVMLVGRWLVGGEILPLLCLSGLTPRLSPAARGRHTQMGCSLSAAPLSLSVFYSQFNSYEFSALEFSITQIGTFPRAAYMAASNDGVK